MAKHQSEAAIRSLAEARGLRPKHKATIFAYGRALSQAGRFDDAAALFAESASLLPKNPTIRRRHGWLLLRADRPALALEAFEKANDLDPDDGDAAHGRGIALRAMGQNDESLAWLETAHRLAPDKVEIILALGRALTEAGRSDEAAGVLERAAAKQPLGAALFRRLGWQHMKAGRPEPALAAFEKAVRLEPEDPDGQRGKGTAHRALGQTDESIAAFGAALRLAPDDPRLALDHGRTLGDGGRFDEATSVLERALARNPENTALLSGLGRLLMRQKRPETALAAFDRASAISDGDSELHRGRGAALWAMGDIAAATVAYEKAVAADGVRPASLVGLAELKSLAGRYDEALGLADQAIASGTDNARIRLLRATIHYGKGNVAAALADCEQALALEPGNLRSQNYLSLLKADRHASHAESTTDICFLEPTTAAAVAEASSAGRPVIAALSVGEPDGEVDGLRRAGGTWKDRIRAATADRILTIPKGASITDPGRLEDRDGSRIGVVGDAPGTAPALWRREILQAALDLYPVEDFATLAEQLVPRLQWRRLDEAPGPLARLASEQVGYDREAWLVSTSGIRLFGGVERFLRGLVPIYRELGFRPIIVGLVGAEEPEGEGEVDGIDFIDVKYAADAMRSLALQRNPAIVHAAGAGYELADALDGLKTRLIYGVHFWRDMFHGTGAFENIDRESRPRPEFALLTARTDQPYANSLFTRETIAAAIGISEPVLYSLPADVDRAALQRQPGRYALLMNGRPDKGLPLVLDVAARVPAIPFRVVASQVERVRLEELVAAAGVSNVEVIDWSADTKSLYRGARAVLVPSYRFTETFSRVTIEAQRFGVPVVGSDRGNVRLLLEESGISMPEDVDAWVGELGRLFNDDAYWRDRSRAARDNADRYPFSAQTGRVDRLVRTAMQRIAIGVGSGIGNIVQCTPAIRRVSEHFGAPVDILLREDFPGCRALLEGAPWVGSVIPAERYAAVTRFDAVLLLDCFNALIPRLNAERCETSKLHFQTRDWRNLHEARLNLMSAERVLGVPFTDEDAARYFVGAVRHAPAPKRVGIHAGCKDGAWLVKRWPHFPELVARLSASGFEVHSFGAKDEHVEGTVDATGTPLATTIANIAKCSYFVANDSGLMHIADALRIPLTSIFAPSSVVKNGPLSDTSRVIAIDRDCSPCQFDPQRMATCTCIGDISLETVAATILPHLEAAEAALAA